LNMGVQRGREAYALLKEGDIDGLSIGYRIKEYSVDTETGVWTRCEFRAGAGQQNRGRGAVFQA